MTKYLIKLLLFIILGLLAVPFLGSCQVKPNEFIEETSPTNSNFEMYSQKNGINRRASLANLKKYFTPYIYGTIAYVPSASGNASNRMEFVVDPNGDSWYIDAGGVGTKLGKSYTAGTGISITGSTITNSGLLPSTTFGGDVTGTYDNLQIGAGKVGTLELTTTGTSSGSFTLPTLTTGPDGRVYSISSNTIGGDVSGTVGNIQIMPGVVGTTELANNSVSENKIGTGQVTMPKIEQAGATTGQAIAWNGTAWAPATISGGGGTITGSGTNGYVARWTGTTALGNGVMQDNGTRAGIPGLNSQTIWNVESTSTITSGAQYGQILLSTVNPPSASTALNTAFRNYMSLNGSANLSGQTISNSSVILDNNTGAKTTVEGTSTVITGSAGTTGTVSGYSTVLAYGDVPVKATNMRGYSAVLKGNSDIGSCFYGRAETYYVRTPTVFRVLDADLSSVVTATTPTSYGVYQAGNPTGARNYFAAPISINSDVTTAGLTVKGYGNTSGTFTAQYHNSTGTNKSLIIRDDGRLGVGTDGPEAKLHIVGAGATSSTIGLRIHNASFTSQINFRDDGAFTMGSNAVEINQGGIAMFRNSTSNNGVRFDPASYPFPTLSAGDFGATTGKAFQIMPNSYGVIFGSTSVAPPAKVWILGVNTATTDYGLMVHNSTGTNNAFLVRNDGLLTAGAYPNTRNDSGSPTNVFSSDASGNIQSHTAAELVAAGGGGTNISNSNLTSTGSYALNLVNNSLTFDASTATNTISQPIIIKAKADGVNSSQPITFQDASSATLGYLYQNNLGVTLGGTTGKSITIASGTFGWTFHPNGVFVNTLHTSDPTTTGLSGGQWVNSTSNRLKFRTSAGVKTVATLEDDMAGMLTTYATDATPGFASYGTRVDAFSAPRTVTLGADLTEGRVYVIKGVRNNTNTITVNAASSYTLEIDGDASIGPTTFNMNAGEVFTAQRFGSQIIINR